MKPPRRIPMGPCVLDASALLAMLHGEPGGDLVEPLLSGATISSVNWAEVLQKSVAAGISTDGMREDIEATGCAIEPFLPEDAQRTAHLWPSTVRKGLSLGDRACLALAARLARPAITADRVWLDVAVGVHVVAIRSQP